MTSATLRRPACAATTLAENYCGYPPLRGGLRS